MIMNLKHKFVLWSAILLSGVLLLGGVSIWNVSSQWRSARASALEFSAMDRAEALSAQVIWLRDSLRGGDSGAFRQAQYFTPIQSELVEMVRELRLAAGFDDGDSRAERDLARSTSDHFDAALRHSADVATSNAAQTAAELELLRQSLDGVTRLAPRSARHHVAAAADRLSARLNWTCLVLLAVLAISIAIHFKQYRTLVKPLLWLRDDMRQSAMREYREPVRRRGDREFKEVATFFNGLSKELSDLYRGLEERVIAKSRELVRSERLASVGFLAAGVAHEINNPLSVMSGYAELAAKSLRRVLNGPGSGDTDGAAAQAEAKDLASALEAQGIIRDEAFRCKEITSRLLSLARGGGEGRQTLAMDEVARQVTILTKGLKNYRDRRVVLDFKQNETLNVFANLSEMKQVLLNLTINALEAIPAERGEVRMSGQRTGDWVELSVADNGKGMSAETLRHVIEPFFTAKRGAGEPGTGLGLSITHAIVENHGGRIRAESGGPGHGSRFTIRLPAGSKNHAGSTATAAAG